MNVHLLRNITTYKTQADLASNQTNPVSTTLYPIMGLTPNVRIISIEVDIVWATTQPTPLDVVVTIDGVATTYTVANPVTATKYYASIASGLAASAQVLETTDRAAEGRPFLCEGRNVKIEVRITWATTQPTPLAWIVKYAKKGL